MKTALAVLAAMLVGVVATATSGGCSKASPCTSWQDCQSSDEANELRPCNNDNQGATIHVDTACVDGRCQAECASTCIPYGCRTPGAVCETPAPVLPVSPSNVVRSCTKNPIACTAAADCPLQKTSESGEWTCEDGFCRFPGFAYAFE